MSAVGADPIGEAWQQTVVDVDEQPPPVLRAPGRPESPLPCLLAFVGSLVSAVVVGVALVLVMLPD